MPWFSLGSKFSFHNSLIHEWQRHQWHHHWSHSGSRLRVFLRARPREDRHLRKANHVLGCRIFWNIAKWVKVILQLHFSVHERFLPWGWNPWGNALLVLGPDQSASEGLLLDPVHWEPPQTAVFRVDYWWVSRNETCIIAGRKWLYYYYFEHPMFVPWLQKLSHIYIIATTNSDFSVVYCLNIHEHDNSENWKINKIITIQIKAGFTKS